MQKWEYVFVTYGSVSDEEPWELISISEADLEDEVKKLNQVNLANFLGDQGWELVSCNPLLNSTLLCATAAGRYLEDNWPQGVPQVFKMLPAIANNFSQMVFKRPKADAA